MPRARLADWRTQGSNHQSVDYNGQPALPPEIEPPTATIKVAKNNQEKVQMWAEAERHDI